MRPLWRLVYWLRGIRSFFSGRGGPVKVVRSESFPTKSVAIVAVYRQRPDLVPLLADLREAGYSILVVFNRDDITPIPEIVANSHLLVTRRNAGRDFGAYAKGVQLLEHHAPDYERVLFVNDSGIYLKRSVPLFRTICVSKAPYAALTESWRTADYLVHGGFFQISRAIMRRDALKRFFGGYRNVNSARYAVENGEKRLSDIMVGQLGVSPEIMFPIGNIVNETTVESAEVGDTLGWFNVQLNNAYLVERPTGLDYKYLDETTMPVVKEEEPPVLRNRNKIRVLELLSSLDPIQDLALLTLLHSDYPFLKHNVLARGYCSFEQLSRLAEHFPVPLRATIIGESLRTYGYHYGAVGLTRAFRFAELWAMI